MESAAALLTLDDWRRAYRDGASPRELLGRRLLSPAARQNAAWQDAGRPDPAWIERVDATGLAAQLDALEARAAAFPSREAALAALPLYGVPFAVKDNIDAAGFSTTAACPAWSYRPAAHAAAVRRLVEAGAVCVGKTNLDQFATGLVGTRSPYGRPASTFDPARVSGGSSSGSAVVVSRGEVPFALGTDTAGSGRVPAGFNNVVGLKPTPGRVSSAGLVPACRSLDCVSVFALGVADAARVLALIEGPDEADPFSAFRLGPARLGSTRPGARLRLGIPREPLLAFRGDAGYEAAFRHAVGQAEALGCEIVPVDFAPLAAVAGLLYGGPWVAERHTVVQPLLDRDPDALDPTVRRIIEAAHGQSATDTFRGLHRLQAARGECAQVWHRADLLMVPTAPGHPTFAEVDADPVGENAALGIYTNFVNLLGWCALALPTGFTARGLPFGVTFIAPGTHDTALARWGLRWEAAVAVAPGAPGLMRPARPAAAASVAADEAGGARASITPVGVLMPATTARPAAAVTPAATVMPAARATVRATATEEGGSAGTAGDGDSAALLWPAGEPTLAVAVVGAHLSGMPLNGQLTERGATLREAIRTAPRYRLHALPGTVPPKPGLVHVAADEDGAAIEVEVWELPLAAVGSFLALVPAPLAIGSVELEDGRRVHGFLCEPHAARDAPDVSAFGGWRAYMTSLALAGAGVGGATATPAAAVAVAPAVSPAFGLGRTA